MFTFIFHKSLKSYLLYRLEFFFFYIKLQQKTSKNCNIIQYLTERVSAGFYWLLTAEEHSSGSQTPVNPQNTTKAHKCWDNNFMGSKEVGQVIHQPMNVCLQVPCQLSC